MLNKLLMWGLVDLEMPPEKSNTWMTCLTCYTAVVGTELFLYIESLWETTEKDRKIQNDHNWEICELKSKVLIQGCALEDHDDMIHKLSRLREKREEALDTLTAKVIFLETQDDDNGERLNNYSYCLGVLELPQLVRESRSNALLLDLILLLGCLCSVSFGVWYCAVFSWMASCSSFQLF